MGMNCGLTKNSLPFTFDTHGHKLYMCWRMSPCFVVLPLNYVHTPCPLPSSPSPINSIPHHSFIVEQKESIQNKATPTPIPHTAKTTAPLSQIRPTMARAIFLVLLLLAAVTVAPLAAEARDVAADVEGRSLADAPSDAPAPSPDSSSSPSDAPSDSSSSSA